MAFLKNNQLFEQWEQSHVWMGLEAAVSEDLLRRCGSFSRCP